MNTVHQSLHLLWNELSGVLSSTLARLVVAAILGGIIGLERQLRHKPAGLRTNMFICFGSAMFTVLSRQLAGTDADSALYTNRFGKNTAANQFVGYIQKTF